MKHKKNWERLALMTGTALTACTPKQEAPKAYNVLIIESDDHAYQMMSCYGGLIETPNMDRIAEGGVRFDNSFVANSISGPSRACLLTGKHSHMNGFTSNERSRFDGDQMTFPKLLQKAGYQTAVIGKWHLHSLPQGFDYWEIFPGQGDYYNPTFITAPNDTILNPGYATELVTQKSLHWLENRDPSKPFMLMVQHKAAHRDWLPRLQDLELYEDVTFPLPETFYDDYAGRPAAKRAEMRIGRDMDPAYDVKMHSPEYDSPLARAYRALVNRLDSADREKYWAFYDQMAQDYWSSDLTPEQKAEWHYQRYMRDYAKVIKPMDEGIGEILDYLEQHDLLKNTLVIYMSDQGFYMGEHGWFDKRFMYEESFRTPMIMHLPDGLDARGAIRELVQNIDLAPTILDLAGVAVPEEIQGVSLLPLLRGEKELPGRDALYYHFYEYPAEHMAMRHYGVRNDRYKLIHFYNDQDFWELYDLQKDPHELTNVYADPGYADVLKEMQSQLLSLQKEYRDTLAISLNNF